MKHLHVFAVTAAFLIATVLYNIAETPEFELERGRATRGSNPPASGSCDGCEEEG